MQRNFITKFRPLLREVNGCNSLAPMLILNRSIQPSPIDMNKCGGGPGKLTPKMAKLQKQFQENDGKPVFLKGGGMDNILYRLTLLLCLVGTLGDIYLWFGYILA
ncbi:uncharacterized protein LOC115759458 [Drosophila novamexicana]|uniref:uncharacterized protein LOC115759458 n=1 Tax=Drosophila novamexicana TaxID=47314 RepID=UPI0011E5C571|nr:uncharacterized protein LOC115759458 [Drosophila novamexicana]